MFVSCVAALRRRCVVCAAAAAALGALNVAGVRAGDECGSATPVGEGIVTGDLATFTGSTGDDTSCTFNDLIDVWYAYTASATGTAIMTTCNGGTNFDTAVAVFDACGGAELVCNDDTVGAPPACSLNGLNRKSTVAVNVTAGATYFVRVSGFNNQTGLYELSIRIGDECANAIPVGEGVFSRNLATNTGTIDDTATCTFDDLVDVWYAYTASNSAIATISTCNPGTNYDSAVAVFDACGGAEVACNDDASGAPPECSLNGLNRKSRVTVSVTAGATYFVRVSGFNNLTGVYELSIRIGDECADPIPVGEGVFTGNLAANTGSTDDTATCTFNDLIDAWYAYTASGSGTATISTCNPGTNYDSAVAVFDACGGAEVACNDDAPGAPPECSLNGLNRKSRVTVNVTAGATYFVRVSGFNNVTGLYELSITLPVCPCELDGVAGVDVFDLLAFLDLWFVNGADADIDGVPGVDVFDLLFFLDCWFPASAGAPCP